MCWADGNHRGQRLKAMRLHEDPCLDPVDNSRTSEGKTGILAGTAGAASGAGLGQLKLKAETLKGFQVHISNFSGSAVQRFSVAGSRAPERRAGPCPTPGLAGQ